MAAHKRAYPPPPFFRGRALITSRELPAAGGPLFGRDFSPARAIDRRAPIIIESLLAARRAAATSFSRRRRFGESTAAAVVRAAKLMPQLKNSRAAYSARHWRRLECAGVLCQPRGRAIPIASGGAL